jgi:uncharacterized protein (DUF1800 family)
VDLEMSLTQWNGAKDWTPIDAAHLLRRTGFGATAQEIKDAHQAGLPATIERLLADSPETSEFAETESILRTLAYASDNINDLKSWWFFRMRRSANPLVEKNTLLWHNHFATSNAKVHSVRRMADQNDLFRKYALGDFRELLYGVSKDTAMLVWLDVNDNRKRAANENFAREIMELFSLGVGNYTERDIKEAARALTGWHVREGTFWFDRRQHDPTNKTVFGKTGAFDGAAIVNLCLDHPACPRFIGFKLLKTYVTDRPTKEQIEAVAETLTREKFNVGRTLRHLLASDLFFSKSSRAAIIKSPIDFVIGAMKSLDATPKTGEMTRILAQLGQDLFEPPTVKGWDGGRLWISAASLLHRTQFSVGLLSGEHYGELPKASFELGTDPERALAQLSETHLATPLGAEAKKAFIEHWKKSDGDERYPGALHLILTSPEYQLG